jgi:hypothetical protein
MRAMLPPVTMASWALRCVGTLRILKRVGKADLMGSVSDRADLWWLTSSPCPTIDEGVSSSVVRCHSERLKDLTARTHRAYKNW